MSSPSFLRKATLGESQASARATTERMIVRMATIPRGAREFLATGPLAHIVTLNPDGTPHVTLAWAGVDGDGLIWSSFSDQHKFDNLRRDPRITLSFQAHESGGEGLHPYLVIRGTATIEPGGALEVMDHLAQWYIGPDATYPARDLPSGWTFRVTVDKFYGQGPWNDRWVEMDHNASSAARSTE